MTETSPEQVKMKDENSRGNQNRTENKIFRNSGTKIICQRKKYDWSLCGNRTGSTSRWDAIRGNPGAKMIYQDSGHCSRNQGIGYQGCQTYGWLWDTHQSGGVNDHLVKLVFTSAGWSEDQGSIELVVWGTRVVLLQEEWRERINQVGFFFSWMEWRSWIGWTGRVGNQSRATSGEVERKD